MYKLVKNENNEIDSTRVLHSDKGTIPNDPANCDWQEYQEWLAQGNEPEEAD